MFCDVCSQNEATVFLTQIVDGKMQKANLCESCSKAKGVTDPTGFALADLLLGIGAEQQLEKGATGTLRCAACGFSQGDFKKTGRLGCSECYDTFAEGLSSMLKALQKGVQHTGKVPAHLQRTLLFAGQMKTLQKDLERAVKSENYESAAELRDKIRLLEGEFKA